MADDMMPDPEKLRALGFEALKPAPEPSPWVSAASLKGPPPPRQWLVPDLIPHRNVTLLNGDGGTGKSLLALQLAAAVATGRRWIGKEAKHGGALFLSAEDELDELHRRLTDIGADLALELAAFDRLMLRSLAGEDAVLGALDKATGQIKASAIMDDLNAWVAEHRPALVVLDTLADLFGGQESDRAQTRQFVSMLRGLALRHDCAVLLLAHPSLTGIATGTGSSGSTAWNASVRSRLYLDRVKEGSYEPDPDARILRTMKSNYGRTGGEIALRWEVGAFKEKSGAADTQGMAASFKAGRVFADLLQAYEREGRDVSHSPGGSYAPTRFVEDPRAEGCTKRMLAAAMNEHIAAGRVRIVQHGPPSKRRNKLEWVAQ